jgi:hypothetical protein
VTNDIAQGKAASAATLGIGQQRIPLPEGEQQMFVAFSDGIFFGRIPRVSASGLNPRLYCLSLSGTCQKHSILRVYFQRAGCQRADFGLRIKVSTGD